MTIERALAHGVTFGFTPPPPGGCAVLRTLDGEYFVGDAYHEFCGSITIRLHGTQTRRAFSRRELFSLAAMRSHSLADARIIAERQRRGEPALAVPLTEKERAARKRWDLDHGKRT